MSSYAKLSPDARKEIDATLWLLRRDITPVPDEKLAALKELLAKTALSCYAAEGIDAWRRMYYDQARRFEGEQLTDKQIAEKAQTHREYMFQEGMLRA